jgi:hypothetical protein
VSSAGGYPPWLLAFVTATIVVSAPAVVAALYAVVQSGPSASTIVGVGVLFSLAFLAELRPVPVDVEGDRLVSLAFVFVVSAQMIFGWDWSVLIGAAAIAGALLVQHVAPLKILFNGGVYALAALIAAAPYRLFSGESATALSYVELTGRSRSPTRRASAPCSPTTCATLAPHS